VGKIKVFKTTLGKNIRGRRKSRVDCLNSIGRLSLGRIGPFIKPQLLATLSDIPENWPRDLPNQQRLLGIVHLISFAVIVLRRLEASPTAAPH
jgi:hypothetical protein